MGKNTKASLPTHIIAVIDRSGSMAGRVGDVIGGFNAFLKDQQRIKDGSFLSLYLFDDRLERPYHNTALENVKELNSETYFVRGGTALLDALGDAMNDAGDYNQTILLVITDGEENSSSKYKRETIQGMIKTREERGWKVIYQGAHANAFHEAANYGINSANSVKMAHSHAGFSAGFANVGLVSSAFRSGNASYTASDVGASDYETVKAFYGQVDTSSIQTAVDKDDEKAA